MLKNLCFFVLVLCFLFGMSVPYTWAENNESPISVAKRLVLVEMRDETESPDWRNQLIALGIANLVTTELYKTGRYVPIEEKPEILQELQELQALSWLNKEATAVVKDIPHFEPPKLADEETSKEGQVKDSEQEGSALQNEGPVSLFERFGCDAVARVVVRNFRKSRMRSIGFISGGSTTIKLNVEVFVEEKDGGFYRGVGEGEGTTNAMAAMFQIRDDCISFDETTVGQATQKAVRQAVANLCKVEK